MRLVQKSSPDSGERRASTPRETLQSPALPAEGLPPPLAGSQRRGFTIIELLVVIAIIAVLASLIVGATMRTIAVQSQKNTTLLVQKIYNAVNAQWNATVEQANGEVIPPAVLTQAAALYGNDMRAARAMYINLRLAQQFPQSYAEAVNGPGYGIPADPFYAQLASGGDSAAVQNGVCLWIMLKNSRNGAIFNQDILTPRELGPCSVPNAFCLVDDWKQPLQFQRMPYLQYIAVCPQGITNTLVQFDLNPQQNAAYASLFSFPVVGSAGAPAGGLPIYSYQLVIGGPNGS